MNKLLVGFVILSFLFSMIEAIGNGGGIQTTRLAEAMTADSEEVVVDSTDGFLDYGLIMISNETIKYTGKTNDTFTGCTRGYRDTEIGSYSVGRTVSTEPMGMIDSAVGFEVGSTSTTGGDINIITFGWNLVTHTLPKIVTWDYAFLNISPLHYIKYLLYIFSVGFIFVVTYYVLSALAGVAQGIWSRVTGV